MSPTRTLSLATMLMGSLAAAGCTRVDDGATSGDSTAVTDTSPAADAAGMETPLVPPSEAAWAPLGRWSGTGDKGTSRFRVTGDEWRLAGTVRRLKKTEHPWIVVQVFDSSRSQVATFSIEDIGSDTTYLHTDPGVYYLGVSTHEARWELAAEERRPLLERPEP